MMIMCLLLTYTGASVALHPGCVRGVGGAGEQRRGPRRSLHIPLRQIQDAPDGKAELGRGSHGVLVCFCALKEANGKQSKFIRGRSGSSPILRAVQRAARCLHKQLSTLCAAYKASSSSSHYLNGWSAEAQ